MKRLLTLLTLLWLALSAPALAHQQKITYSTIAHNPRTGMLEVIHRVPIHDAEHALKTQGMRAPDIVNDVESRRAFARYVERRFMIDGNKAELSLTLLGTDIIGGNLIVYQEGPSPRPGARLTVNSQVLTDVWARQVNRVNIGAGTNVETLIFRDGDNAQTALLP